MSDEVGERHLAREQEGDRAREQADQQQAAADHFEQAGDAACVISGAVPPPGIREPGHASSLPVPSSTKTNAAMMRSRLSR